MFGVLGPVIAEHPDGRACPRVLLAVDHGPEDPVEFLIPDAADLRHACLPLGPLSAETVRGVQEAVTSAHENVRDLNVRLIDMAQANTDAAFDLAREVAEAKAPSDMVQAWTTHATKQFDMLTKQASELTTLGQQFASTSSEPVTRRVAQGSKR